MKAEKKKNQKPEKKPVKKIEFKLDVKKLKDYFNKKTLTGITLVGMLLLLVLYVFVYLSYTQKTEELEKENAALQASVNELQEYYDNMATYQASCEQMESEIAAVISEYPADVREEDIIMLAVELQEHNTITYDAINMEEKEGVWTVASDIVNASGIEGLDEELVFVKKHAVYVNTTDYEDLKSIISQIYEADNRIGIDNIVYVKNEEDGTLEGNIDVYFYSLAGTDKEYTAPDIAQYLSGTSDLFQSDKVTATQTITAEEETENGETENEETVQEE